MADRATAQRRAAGYWTGDRVVVKYIEHAPEISERQGTVLRTASDRGGNLEVLVLFDYLPDWARNPDRPEQGGMTYWIPARNLRRIAGRRGGAPSQAIVHWGPWRARGDNWHREEGEGGQSRRAIVYWRGPGFAWRIEDERGRMLAEGAQRELSRARAAADRWIAANQIRRIV